VSAPAAVRVHNRIGGERHLAGDGGSFERRDPADTRRVVSQAPESTGSDVAAAVEAAAKAAPAWAATLPGQRAAILERAAAVLEARADPIAVELVREEGKPLDDARNELRRTPGNLRLHAGEAVRHAGRTFPPEDPGATVATVVDPVGTVGVITPWNFPLTLASRKIAPALAAGNTVVFKPSPMTPLMGERLADAFEAAGLPPGVLNVVHGSAAGALLVADERVGAVTFTGSTATGRRIHAAVGLGRRVQLELGGKNPLVVLADADLDRAADVVVRSSFSLSGQACTGAGRILVAEEVHDALVERLVVRTGQLRVGDGLTEGVTVGPLVDRAAVDAMERTVQGAIDAGAHVLCGGTRLSGDGFEHGCFFPPTLLTDVTPDMAVARDEVFGPVVGIERIGGLDEAITRANDTPYGLIAAVCTQSLAAAHRFCADVRAGMVKVNRPTIGAASNAPFGGLKLSGTGTHKEQLGPSVMDFYTVTRTVVVGV
jgi:aldehyde dehydrogenase (NAD+)